jgi:hypothetical protein
MFFKFLIPINLIALLFLSLTLFSCDLIKKNDDDDDETPVGDINKEATEIKPDQTSDGDNIAKLDPSSDKAQIIYADDDSHAGNSYISFLPGSLAKQTEISFNFIAKNDSDSSDQLPTDYGLDETVHFDAAGPEVHIATAEDLQLENDFEIGIELDDSEAQALTAGNLIIIFQAMKLKRYQYLYGVIAPDSITLKDNIAKFRASYFGIYRPVYTTATVSTSTDLQTPWTEFFVDDFNRADTTYDSKFDRRGASYDPEAFLGSNWKALTDYDRDIAGASIQIEDEKVKCVGACIAEYRIAEPSASRVRMGITFSVNSYALTSDLGTIGILDSTESGGCPIYAGFFCSSSEGCKIGMLDKDNSTAGGSLSYFGTPRPILPRAGLTYMIEAEQKGDSFTARLKTASGMTIQTLKETLPTTCVIEEPSFHLFGFDDDKVAIFDDFYFLTSN